MPWCSFDITVIDIQLASCLYLISMASCKTAVSPLLMHWRYCSLALSWRWDAALYINNRFYAWKYQKLKLRFKYFVLAISNEQSLIITWWYLQKLSPFIMAISNGQCISLYQGIYKGCHFLHGLFLMSNLYHFMKVFTNVAISVTSTLHDWLHPLGPWD